jgi:oligoribonuclease NrnB/cAMP/cGMP phosphodiesterase (DHH superfamily)
MVDFSLRTREQNDQINAIAKSFRILDHHKSAKEVLEGAPYAVFDMNRSGAGITWDYLFGSLSSCQRPWWVNYVEDRDLWKFSLAMSKEVNAYIMTFAYNEESWTKMTKVEFLEAASAGEHVLLQVEKYVREAVKMAQFGTLNIGNARTYTVAVVNVPYLNTSEVGDALSRSKDIGLGWFERADGVIQFSARSHGDVDVSEVAKVFGGGGHRNAAGFQLPLKAGRDLIDTILGRNNLTTDSI